MTELTHGIAQNLQILIVIGMVYGFIDNHLGRSFDKWFHA
jgi:hypothetical protein